MFKITRLSLYGYQEGDKYDYSFVEGINFFKGINDSGKTEFYAFIDYMFGARDNLSNRVWYKGSLQYAELSFEYNGISFVLTRYIDDKNLNYIQYSDEPLAESIRLDEYRDRLNSIFSPDDESLKELRSFVGEDISYRTFTIFNFLSEDGQGSLQDFFTKSKSIKYAIKLPAILNYIFNSNLKRIKELSDQEEKLSTKIERLERSVEQNKDIETRINKQLKVLNIHTLFTGRNGYTILREIDKLQDELEHSDSQPVERTVEELEAVYTSIDEQIKRQTNIVNDYKVFVSNSTKQQKLLDELSDLIRDFPGYAYLAVPIAQVASNLNKSISFNKYLIQENAIRELKKQREKIRLKLLSCKSRYKVYSVSDKKTAVAIIREHLNYYNVDPNIEKIDELRRQLNNIRTEKRALQNANDTDKISDLSTYITKLYRSASQVSDLVAFDFSKNGFTISYLKSGNIIQPQIVVDDTDVSSLENYYTGSMARHTLMQLCGYLAFLKLLITENKCPLIPLLVIDHISKPFDKKNIRAIGEVLHDFYKDVPPQDFQILLFDDEEAKHLNLLPNKSTDLIAANKSGFNPFYHKEVDVKSSDN